MTRLFRALAATLLAAGTAHAQPSPDPAPLATLRDDKQLAESLAQITQDPAIQVTDPNTRALAQALMTEGVKQLQAGAFDQALANFLEAYARFPSPKILLNVASTLRDMGRLADAANTYQRYVTDPATGPERMGEVKSIIVSLDEQLTILIVRVLPHGSDVSIDGGPYIPVGTSLLTRVRPGIHLIRIRKGDASSEVTVNGFEGENKEVSAVLQLAAAAATPTPPQPDPKVIAAKPTEIHPAAAVTPEHVDGWLITGTQYSSDSATGRERKVRTGYAGPELVAIIPSFESSDDGLELVQHDTAESIDSGVIAVLRIDGEGRGFAGGAGLAISRGRLEAEIMVLKSDSTGGYLGIRYRLLTGWLRPYIGVGMPGFAYDQIDTSNPMAMTTSTKLALGVRGAGGVELMINGHFSVQADLGYEHFFVGESTRIDRNIFVPTLGVIGRL